MTDTEIEEIGTAIETAVHQFYARARQDPLLGDIFNSTVIDWDVHLRVITNFWSDVLLKTKRYSGHPFVAHVHLPIEPHHIEHWLSLFTEIVHDTLPPQYAEIALARARMMGESFRVGIFPFIDKEGKPSRHPV